ncbi:MAG: hypothetical protein HC815_37540 [Richelia sp. RM1_1_1]|nr:hypothetical protein [Richelia sp. RM1_1_1]
MTTQLDLTEINQIQQLLNNYEPAQKALDTLEQNKGNFNTTFDELWNEKFGTDTYGKKSLWQSTLTVLREELCGNDGFRAQFQEYTKNPGSAPLLTGLIVSITTLSGLPLDPAISTVVVLYLLKVGLKIFCEYTEPDNSN